ncbi:cytochrome-c peroxidase [Panacibacter ginsenosidivorans]|uniref:Cytochrome-c peroxidase n=1 Tax=Panacibacter ginsenosidivorans TaxID=1813871 RepID=A0A5B8VE60_9BACT|nr:cytochrome c peroxidase [Panacibacter ginsenosidivorans]QEC69764.1 cytochrome-c peroxidase [Panacibacter ginsenosidivorans]
MKKTLIHFSLLALFISGCQKSDLRTNTRNSIPSKNDPDNVKTTAVALAAYRLPDSDDFASIPQDPKNPLTAEKVELGKLLFHESRLGINNLSPQGLQTYSCATCHHAEAGFQSGLAQGIGEGGIGFGTYGETRVADPLYDIGLIDVGPIRTPSVLNTAYSEVMMWNGQFGGTGVNIGTEAGWTPGTTKYNNYLGYQGLETTGLGAEVRHRLQPDTAWLASVPEYKNLFDLAFPDLPDTARITDLTVSLALAAYQRTLLPNQSPFQLWLRGDEKAMTKDEKDGKTLFFSKAKCATCHTSPGLNAATFYSLGMNNLTNGISNVLNVSSGAVEHKGRGGFTGKNKDLYKFKTPQLYNLKDVKFFGHGSSFSSVSDVIHYLNNAVPQNPNVPVSQLAKQFQPLYLTEDEMSKLTKFVEDALYDPNLSRYVPASLPSASCIPNNDAQSKTDRGCN